MCVLIFKFQYFSALSVSNYVIRDQKEEYVNEHCVYETKIYLEYDDDLTALKNRVTALEALIP